ncbi:hypothetical protein [Pontixanthobacter sp. CEM42]|uniref:hypothetical protein n=1 Tax=Pontixanthobacter sp. CEM42 TaxID=2792077 RepID=UPI001ADF1C2A|nr:hypothetical protein [Pontixanthobacter sp. CEM42]
MSEPTDAKIVKYQFEVPIKRSPADIWDLMINHIDAWWMEDFRALGEGSTVTLGAEAGGQLVETGSDGSVLEWYRVQMITPGKSLYLVGYLAPDWGGPTTSMLKLAVEERDDGGVLSVSDALHGNVTESSAGAAEGGWKMLFNDGLKGLAEK